MPSVNLKNIANDLNTVDSYLLFKSISSWCNSNVKKERWQFDYASVLCVYGVDFPRRIIFWHSIDCVAFKLKFGINDSIDISPVTQYNSV